MFLILSMLFIWYSMSTYAKNNNNKNIVVSEKYSWKKLERIKSTIKTNNNYRFLIDSSESLESIKAFFIAWDKKAKVKQLWDTTFMIRLPAK